MGRKKQFDSMPSVSIDLPEEAPEVKKKKVLSDKQRENLAKGMAILKARRESKSKKEDTSPPETPVEPIVKPVVVEQKPVAVVEQKPVVVEPVVKKERKPRVVKNYLTTEDFNSFKNELLTTLKPSSVPSMPSMPSIPATPVSTTKERLITGSEMLNLLFKL